MKSTVWVRDKMKPNEQMLVLFKFGEKGHLTSLREQGLMHMRTMRYFANGEAENIARADRFEGASTIFQPDYLRLTISHPAVGTHEIDPNDLAGPVILSLNSEAEQNIFCMFSLTEPSTESLLHEDHLNFGSHFVVILNTPEFIRRIEKALKREHLEARAGPVEYYDDTIYSGEVGAFRKPKRFAYQKEYRIVTEPGLVPFRNLVIGDISDIASEVSPLSELDRIVDFSERTAIEGGWVKVESSDAEREKINNVKPESKEPTIP